MSIADDVKAIEASRDDWRGLVIGAWKDLAAVTKERDEWRARAQHVEGVLAVADPVAVRTALGADDGESLVNAAWRVVRERDDAIKRLCDARVEACDAIQKSNLVDPRRWRGPHGESRADDAHRWREASVNGRIVLSTVDSYDNGKSFNAFAGGGAVGIGFQSIGAACAAADEYVAKLATPKRTFTVERRDHNFRVDGGDWVSLTHAALAVLSPVVGAVSPGVAEDFVFDHAQLFRDGGTITEDEVKSWLKARKP